MNKFLKCLIPACVLLSVVSGCQTKNVASDGAGFEALHPLPVTRNFIILNDPHFAGEVVAHNRTCAEKSACRK